MSEQNKQGAIPDLDDRSQLDVSGRGQINKKPLVMVVFLLASILVVWGVLSLVYKQTKKPEAAIKKDEVASLVQSKAKEDALGSLMSEVKQQDEQKKLIEQQQQQGLDQQQRNSQDNQALNAQLPMPVQEIYPPTQADGKPVMTPRQRKAGGEVMVSFGGEGNKTAEHQSGVINDSLRGEYYANGSASVRPDLSYLLVHGTNIACVLKTKIVTTYKGVVICQATKDTYSADGKTLLIDRGSQIFGEQKVALTQGQARVFINWTTIETPSGVHVRIDSLGTDSLGAAGANAWVDRHFAERFGGAIMLSFLSDAFQTMANLANKNNTVVVGNSQQATTDMATKALENTINIPPTAYVNQGALMNILLARDIDMRNIYENH